MITGGGGTQGGTRETCQGTETSLGREGKRSPDPHSGFMGIYMHQDLRQHFPYVQFIVYEFYSVKLLEVKQNNYISELLVCN